MDSDIVRLTIIYYELRRLKFPDEDQEKSMKIAKHYGTMIFHLNVWNKVDDIIKSRSICKKCGVKCQMCGYGSNCLSSHPCPACD